jgi:hypothetical protein
MMKRQIRRCLAFTATCLASTSACAHAQVPSTLEVRVLVNSTWKDGSERAVGLRVAVAASSSRRLLSFYLDAPVQESVDTARLGGSGNLGHWMVMDHFADRRVQSWTNAKRPLPAGETTPRFLVRGQGVFGLVQYWTAFHQESAVPDSMPVEMPDSGVTNDTIVHVNGPTGWTLGILAPPPDESASTAANRLSEVISRLCSLEWISPRGVCTSLLAKVSHQREQLDALTHELQAQRGKGVSEGAYVIIVEAIEHVRASPAP